MFGLLCDGLWQLLLCLRLVVLFLDPPHFVKLFIHGLQLLMLEYLL